MIVVSNDGFNETPRWRSVIVVPVSTSGTLAARGPTAIRLSEGSGGMKKASLALCHQVTTLDREKLVQRIGSLVAEQIARLEDGLRAALDIG